MIKGNKEKKVESKNIGYLDFFSLSIYGKFDFIVKEITGKIKEKLLCLTLTENDTVWFCLKDKILVKEIKNGII